MYIKAKQLTKRKGYDEQEAELLIHNAEIQVKEEDNAAAILAQLVKHQIKLI
jgi:hypothetical protein